MRRVFRNGRFAAFLPELKVTAGDLILTEGVVEAFGPGVAGSDGVDLHGALVLPGLVNAHTHLYSALGAGMPAPPKTPTNFTEILQQIWWRLDRALDLESINLSALVGGLEAARSGVTVLFDHHASPNAIDGSLDQIALGLAEIGVRGSTCYEVSDRGGLAKRDAGIRENIRFAESNGDHKGLIGGHASFTLGDETLAQLGAAVAHTGQPFHIHVAEDRADLKPGDPIARYQEHGLITPGAIIAHGVYLDESALAQVIQAGAWLAHQPRSNMNNAVGYAAAVASQSRIAVGTDGIGCDVLTEVRTAFLKAQEARLDNAWMLPLELLQSGLRLAEHHFGVGTGRFEVGERADLVVTDYVPHTPLVTDNFIGHLLFGFDRSHVREVVSNGDTIWPARVDTLDITTRSRAAAQALWDRMDTLTGDARG
jgi:putative selenium metabolism protein SsnA